LKIEANKMGTQLNRPLLENEILDAQDRSRSASEAARYLRVSYKTYTKYAKLYGIHDRLKNQCGRGIPKSRTTENQGTPLKEILDGEHPKYKSWKLRRRLFNSGYKEQKCEICGFDEKRLTDDKSPLKLHYIDNDNTNHRYDNIQIICYNCYFLTVGNVLGRKKNYFLG